MQSGESEYNAQTYSTYMGIIKSEKQLICKITIAVVVNITIRTLIILSRATKGKSNPRLKGNRKGIIVKGKEFYIPILNTFPTR